MGLSKDLETHITTQLGIAPPTESFSMYDRIRAAHAWRAQVSAHACMIILRYQHPFYEQLANLEYLPSQLGSCIEQPFQPLESVPFHFVRHTPARLPSPLLVNEAGLMTSSLTREYHAQVATEKDLRELANKLDAQTEFAVDLEHHSYRTFQGFTCLMQISTRTGTLTHSLSHESGVRGELTSAHSITEDFIVDTLALREHMHLLGSSFHDANVVKVLHGSDSDIMWLQRDFGLYVVNMFDTGQVS
jgi:hypothetical protein